MFRNIANIMVVALLLVTTTGFTFSRHYCGAKLVPMSINSKADSCCDNEKGNCCHDETQLIQLKEDFISSVTYFHFDNASSIYNDFISNFLFNFNEWEEKTNDFLVFIDSPPPKKIQYNLAKLQTYLL